MNQDTRVQVTRLDPSGRYDAMLRLADLFDSSGAELRDRAKLGRRILDDDDVSATAPLSQRTFHEAEDQIRSATSGRRGLLPHAVDLDADALVVRVTVLTYQWIDELEEAATRTLGAIAGRAIGYLAPEVELGGTVVSAGLIETDALERDGVAAYLNELTEGNPELLEHISSGGGLLESLQLRSMLTVSVLSGPSGGEIAREGRRAAGIAPLPSDFGAALRDAAGGVTQTITVPAAASTQAEPPRSMEDLVSQVVGLDGVRVVRVAPGRFIAYLNGAPDDGRLRLVGNGVAVLADAAAQAMDEALTEVAAGQAGSKVMLVGAGQGGAVAAHLAADSHGAAYTVEQVVTVGAPSAHLASMPDGVRVLSLEDRADPVALLGSLINARDGNRVTVVYDSGEARGSASMVAGGRAADRSDHPELAAEIDRLRQLGYLAG